MLPRSLSDCVVPVLRCFTGSGLTKLDEALEMLGWQISGFSLSAAA
jgi:hypothetical protein